MTCIDRKCEYDPTTKRKLTIPQDPQHILYALLWEKVVLPKLLEGREFKW
jgi:hypothetical protein